MLIGIRKKCLPSAHFILFGEDELASKVQLFSFIPAASAHAK